MTELAGRLVIRGLRCKGRQGPSAADQERVHDYLVDITVLLNIADAVARDDLASALDIAELASCVRDEMAARPRVLLERVAADVARAVIGRFERVSEVRVKVEKPDPEGLAAAAEAVEIVIPRR